MTDGPETSRKGQRARPGGPVESLASRALKIMASQRIAGSFAMSEGLVELLRHAVAEGDETDRHRLLDRMAAQGVPPEAVIDHYIPEVARRLGEEWCSDHTGFATVTIGSARLQSMVRDLGRQIALPNGNNQAPGMAVVVLAEEYHTLGAMILTSQLRRLGVSVRLLLGAVQGDAVRTVRADKFDAVLISASHTETLAHLEKFIKNLKREAGPETPIILGGPILNVDKDVKSKTGADYATSDAVEVLRLCQLRTSQVVGPVKKTRA